MAGGVLFAPKGDLGPPRKKGPRATQTLHKFGLNPYCAPAWPRAEILQSQVRRYAVVWGQ